MKLGAIALLTSAIVVNGASVLSAAASLAILLLITSEDKTKPRAKKVKKSRSRSRNQQPEISNQESVVNYQQSTINTQPKEPNTENIYSQPQPISIAHNQRLYREAEKRRIVAAILAKSSILVVGAEGMGKTYLASAVVEQLRNQDFAVVLVEPTSPKQMLMEICDQLGLEATTIEGKSMTIDQLRSHISSYLATNTVVLVLDDAHLFEQKQRLWFKLLTKQRQPMAVFATSPPKTDLFLSLAPLSLTRLPEPAIRELMELASLEYGVNLSTSELAALQPRAGGNPTLARRIIEEFYLGIGSDEEASDAINIYFDAAPLVLILGIIIVSMRFVALGINNPEMYIFAGVGSTIFIFISKLLFRIPPDSRRVE